MRQHVGAPGCLSTWCSRSPRRSGGWRRPGWCWSPRRRPASPQPSSRRCRCCCYCCCRRRRAAAAPRRRPPAARRCLPKKPDQNLHGIISEPRAPTQHARLRRTRDCSQSVRLHTQLETLARSTSGLETGSETFANGVGSDRGAGGRAGKFTVRTSLRPSTSSSCCSSSVFCQTVPDTLQPV